jgi:leader peptidase (prepilin peptidase)/N-methyltransferase
LPNWFYIPWLFVVGSCVGSFLNVVVYRLPRGQSLVYPPSRCPKCEHPLAWYDNVPVLGWIMLRGKCRYCREPISPRYPIIEAVCGTLFTGFYVAIFIFHQGPFWPVGGGGGDWAAPIRMQSPATDWPIFGLYLVSVSTLLAASLIDAELFLIPMALPAIMAGVAVLVHTFVDRAGVPGALIVPAPYLALAAGSGIGLLISIMLLRMGILPLSFAEGEPALEVDKLNKIKSDDPPPPEYTPAQVRKEIAKEMLFLLPPLGLGALAVVLQMDGSPLHGVWSEIAKIDWVGGLLGSVLGGLVAGGMIWFTRIIFSFIFGREAMGLGDIDLMFAIGSVIGAGASVAVFFIAPFFGIPIPLAMYVLKSRHELPYGPYLSMAAVVMMLFYYPAYALFEPGLMNIALFLRSLI